MSDLSVSVGLNTSNALTESKKYIKSLNDIVEVSEKLEQSTKALNEAIKTSSKEKATTAKTTNKAKNEVQSLEKAYTPLQVAIKKLTADQNKLNALVEKGTVSSRKAKEINSGLTSQMQKLTDKVRKSSSAYLAHAQAEKTVTAEANKLIKRQQELAASAMKARVSQEKLGDSIVKMMTATSKQGLDRYNKHLANMSREAQKAITYQERLGAAMAKDTAKRLADNIKRASAAELKLAADAKKAADALDKQNRALKTNVDAWGAVKRIAALAIFGTVSREIYQTLKAFDGLNAAMAVASGGAVAAGKNMEYLTKLSGRLGTDVLSSAENFVKFSAAAKESSLSAGEVQTVFEAVQTSGRALNLSVDDMNGTMRALTQIMSKGKVQAEELRGQLGERLPGAFQVAALAMGKTTAELNKMLELGQVTSDEFLLAFAGQLPKSFKITEEAMHSLAAEQARLRNSFNSLVLVAGENGFESAIKSLITALSDFANSDEVIEFVKGLGKLLTSLGEGFSKLLNGIKATIGVFNQLAETFPQIGNGVNFLAKNIDTLVVAMLSLKALGMVGTFASWTTGLVAGSKAAEKTAKSFNKLQTNLLILAATFSAGFAVGTWLNQFEWVKIAGTALVEYLLISFEAFKAGLDFIWGGITNSGVVAFETLRKTILDKVISMVEIITSGLGAVNINGVFDSVIAGAEGLTDSLKGTSAGFEATKKAAIENLKALGTTYDNLKKKVIEIDDAFTAQRNAIKKDAAAKEKNSKATDKLTKATKALADEEAARTDAQAKEIRRLRIITGLYQKYKDVFDPIGKAQVEFNDAQSDLNTLLEEGKKGVDGLGISQEQYNDALDHYIKKLEEIKKSDPAKVFDTDTKKLIKDADKIGDAWLKVGDNMAGAFGDVLDQLNELAMQNKEYLETSTKLTERKSEIDKSITLNDTERNEQLLKVREAQGQLDARNTEARLGQFSAIAGAMASNAKAGSKAAKVLTIASQGLAVAQAISAVANQGTGDPYTAFARIAAMIATMASLGISIKGSVSGSGGDATARRQQTQGTGSVLGDAGAKSESLTNALERLEEVDLDQYTELRGIFNEMVSLNKNITRFSAGLVKAFGDFTGKGFDEGALGLGTTQNNAGLVNIASTILSPLDSILGGVLSGIVGSLFGSTKKTIVDSGIKFTSQAFSEIISGGIDAVAFADIKKKKSSLFGLSSSTSYSQETSALGSEVEDQLTSIFLSMGDTITSALDVLGINAANSLESFVVDIGEISLEGLSGDEIQAELEAVFSQQGDLMAEHVLPSLIQFQEVGEGLFDTLLRVAQETATFEQGLKLIGVGLAQFSEVSGEEFLNMSQAAIDAAGGIEAYQAAVIKFSKEVLNSSTTLALAASNAQTLSQIELADIGFTLTDLPNVAAFNEAFEQIKNSLSPEEIVEWIQAGNALADLDKAMSSFEDTVAKMLKPFQDLRSEISDIIAELEGDVRTASSVGDRLAQAQAAVDMLVGGGQATSNVFQFPSGKQMSQPTGQTPPIIGGPFFPTPTKPTTTTLPILVGDAEEQLGALEELRDAILDNYDYQMKLIEEERAGIESLISAAQEFKAGVTSFLTDIQSNIQTLEEAAVGFDTVAARAADVAELQNQLASSSELTRENELALLGELQSAIMASYAAQQAAIKDSFSQQREAIKKLTSQRILDTKAEYRAKQDAAKNTLSTLKEQYSERVSQENQLAGLRVNLAQKVSEESIKAQEDAAQSAYDSAQALFEAWQGAAQSLNSFLESLDLSALSPLTNQQRLDSAEGRFEDLLAKAQSGDAVAASQLADASQAYLTEARSFFASSTDYTDIFDSVKSQVEGVKDLAEAVQAPTPLSIGDQAIVDSSNAIRSQIHALESVMNNTPTSSDLEAQILSQESLLESLSLEEQATLDAISAEESVLLQALSEAETLALEALRIDTISQLSLLEARAVELNELVDSELSMLNEQLAELDARANLLREQTVEQLTELNSLIEQLETSREDSMREEFEGLITANNNNADRIIGAITDSNTSTGTDGTGDTTSGPNPPDGNNKPDGGEVYEPFRFAKMQKSLESIDSRLAGGGGGAIFQPTEQGIEAV